MTIVAYTYKADTYCLDCIVAQVLNAGPNVPTEDALDALAAEQGIDRLDEATYDSGDFPKVLFSVQIETDEFCGGCLSPIR